MSVYQYAELLGCFPRLSENFLIHLAWHRYLFDLSRNEHKNCSFERKAMTEASTVLPGRIEGFLSGCPFCTSLSIGILEVGTRFRIISGVHLGAVGTVVEWHKNMPYMPNEFLAHLDHEPTEWQSRVCIERQMIQVVPFAPAPDWAPPLCMSDAGEIDQVTIRFCESSSSKGKWKTDWDSFNEIVRKCWERRLPLEPNELWLVLKAHGVPQGSKAAIIKFYERGRRLLVHSFGRKPVKKKRVVPLFL
jgi:hypothetical protein